MSAIRTRFRFSAVRRDGTAVNGELAAASSEHVYERLAANDLLPLSIAVTATPARRRPLSAGDLAIGLRILADVIDAGLPMQRALALFGELAPAAWQPALPEVRESIREGRSLSGALADSTLAIPGLVVGMVRAGESGQGLGRALRRAAEHAESAARIRTAIRGALAYPAFVALAGAMTLALMIGVVIPRFAIMLADLGQSLPTSTRLVLTSVELARIAGLPMLVLLAAGAIGIARVRRTEHGRARIDGFLLRLPLIGETRRAAATAHVTATLGALLESGIAFPSALRLAADASGDASIAQALRRSGDELRTGEPIASALRRHPALSSTAIRLLDAGERTGRLIPLLEHTANMERARALRIIESAVRFLEPALILVFALIVGVVAIALLQAVYAVRPG